MRLLDGEDKGAVVRVVRVHGEGAFRQRLLEMGFVRGAKVTVVKSAPLLDPVEYMIMGSHISLRHSEAAQVEVCGLDEPLADTVPYNGTTDTLAPEQAPVADDVLRVALVGNPNCGKTSLFNIVTGAKEKVGNYGGVTVDSKEGEFRIDGRKVELVDLPGTYSLTEYSPEEMYVRTFMRDKRPDAILNVVDAGNLERNLYLTTQLMDMNVPMVLVLNMWDEFERTGDRLDTEALSRLLGVTIVPVVAREGKGVEEMLRAAMDTIEHSEQECTHKNVNYGSTIEHAIAQLEEMAPSMSRYTLLKVIENDSHAQRDLHDGRSEQEAHAIIDRAAVARREIEREYNDDIVSVLSDLKYGFVRGALAEVLEANPKSDKSKLGFALDVVLTNRYLGLPVLFLLMWLVFQTTFAVGAYPQEWIESGVSWVSEIVSGLMPEGTLRDLVVDGVIAGVGGVLVFLPNILILFFFISILEDSGYMARAAFIVDRIMHRIGLHGKSFIPYLIGFGCGVPAIMATRTLENRRDRIITILTVPFMSCSARLPAYLLMVSAFFASNQGMVLLNLYLTGIAMAALSAILLSKTILKHDHTQFVMELPPYRMPTARNATLHMWSKGSQYLHKMGTVILAASIIVWALGYFPRHEGQSQQEQIENSLMGRMGKAIEPLVEPLGFNWQMGVSVLTGAAAKEIVVSSMSVIYTGESDADETSATLKAKLQSATDAHGNKVFNPIVAYSFMLFVLLYFPCIAALAAIKREAGWRWMVFEIVYTTAVAWLASFVFYQSATFIQSL